MSDKIAIDFLLRAIAMLCLCPLFHGCATCNSSDWLVNGREEALIHSTYDIRVLTHDVIIVNEQVSDVFDTHFDKVFIGDGGFRHSSMQKTICAGTKVKISGIVEIHDRPSFCLIPIPLVWNRHKYAIYFYIVKDSEVVTQSSSATPFAFVIKHKSDVNLLPLSIVPDLPTIP